MGTIRAGAIPGGARQRRFVDAVETSEAVETAAGPRVLDVAPLDLVALGGLMARTRGRPETVVGLVDGPVAVAHPGLRTARLRELPGDVPTRCAEPGSEQCRHGTFVAGILTGRRGTGAPAVCPDCTVLLRSVFAEGAGSAEGAGRAGLPLRSGFPLPTGPEQLAAAIVDTVDAGARVVNVSADLSWSAVREGRSLTEALDHAARRGVIVVVAAGNQGVVGGSVLTRHPAVIPVAACDRRGRPAPYSNLAGSIARAGLSAPGEGITSLATAARQPPIRGTSVAAPLVTGAIALLYSEFPHAGAAEIRRALCGTTHPRRALWPDLLDAARARERLARWTGGTRTARRTG
ncbi:S8 family serine peptidase [Streptomyces sp. 1331.2]|uniref:S8 family serine peptidase n=1 Tax=Streptomyces sp. 1331.2 TaxID=1938835 RepID=UPI000BC79E14|nr:S8 family serine peptidase [Streptomyces sp. 1331.2]SOB89012.1 Subtilase family protein [Streptomyces sp. 1331.2]